MISPSRWIFPWWTQILSGHVASETVLIHELHDIVRHRRAPARGLGIGLKLAALLEHVGDFLLILLRLLDLIDVAEGRILGRRGQFHLQLGENEVDACACAEAVYAADASRIPDSADLAHDVPLYD